VTSFFGIKVCVFLENDETDLRQIFFSGFRRKHLFITPCIEKHCTRPLTVICSVIDNKSSFQHFTLYKSCLLEFGVAKQGYLHSIKYIFCFCTNLLTHFVNESRVRIPGQPTQLQTVHHRLNISSNSCVALALQRGDGQWAPISQYMFGAIRQV